MKIRAILKFFAYIQTKQPTFCMLNLSPEFALNLKIRFKYFLNYIMYFLSTYEIRFEKSLVLILIKNFLCEKIIPINFVLPQRIGQWNTISHPVFPFHWTPEVTYDPIETDILQPLTLLSRHVCGILWQCSHTCYAYGRGFIWIALMFIIVSERQNS